MRGNNRASIYTDNQDKYHLMRIIGEAHERFRFTILAFCIMSNHFHILLKSEDDLSKIMSRINRRYSDYYSKRYHHIGHIYQRRYFAKAINTPAILLIVSRYIHRNPIETKIPIVSDLANYPHSSFPLYTDLVLNPLPYIDTKTLPLYLPSGFTKDLAGYQDYCIQERPKEELEMEKLMEKMS